MHALQCEHVYQAMMCACWVHYLRWVRACAVLLLGAGGVSARVSARAGLLLAHAAVPDQDDVARGGRAASRGHSPRQVSLVLVLTFLRLRVISWTVPSSVAVRY